MGEGPVGSSNRVVRPTGVVERAGSVTDRSPRREQQNQKEAAERRRKEPPNPRRRRVYDLLFEEIDQIGNLSEQQRTRAKENIRNHVLATPVLDEPLPSVAPPPLPAEDLPSPEHDDERVAERLLADPHAEVPVDHEHIVSVAAPVHPHLAITDAEENRILAEQLRLCLAQHTARARKLAVYLHVLLNMNRGDVRPTLVLDI